MRRKVEANVCNKPTSQSAYSSCVQPPRDRSSCSSRDIDRTTHFLTSHFSFSFFFLSFFLCSLVVLILLLFLNIVTCLPVNHRWNWNFYYIPTFEPVQFSKFQIFTTSRRVYQRIIIARDQKSWMIIDWDFLSEDLSFFYFRSSGYFEPKENDTGRTESAWFARVSWKRDPKGGLRGGFDETIANPERTRARAFVRAGYLKNKVAFAETGLLFTHIVRA